MILRNTVLPLASFFLCAGHACAGALADGAWSPINCGQPPAALKLDMRDTDAYNRSVDLVNTYRKANRAYIDCAVKEANLDIQTVTKAATAVQQAGKEADEKIVAEVKAAAQKLDK